MNNKNTYDALYEKTLASEVKFDGKIMTVVRDTVELSDGTQSFREVVHKHGGVCIVPLTKDDEVVFVNQFRYPYGQVVKEVPAGKMEMGEDPLLCGIRELSEETGYYSDNIISLGTQYPSPGFTDEILYMYLATDVKEGNAHLDEGELVVVEKIPLEKAVNMILDGTILDGKTQTAILKTWLLKKNGVI
ncbi:MAG: NUDIX hydrolase [Clostridia bacterium]|nr:NUDIX hydrolase [Clostridia bacterium]